MQVESLDNTDWDVVIAGTGLHQSLLALALSRSNKKILHVDRNAYYGGSEAAFSLQEADEWMKDDLQVHHRPAHITNTSAEDGKGAKLSFPRAYSLALAPQLIYTQAKLIQNLVASKAFRQLEFQAMGSWWLYTKSKQDITTHHSSSFIRIPINREDIAFSNTGIDLRSKRAIMKVLRFIVAYEEQTELWQPFSSKPFATFLQEQFKLSVPVVDLFSALALSPFSIVETSTEYALPRIARHLRSIGRLGPGFSSVIPKWGGLSEVAQVGCRAGAVGGAVYVLNNSISNVEPAENIINLSMTSGDKMRTRFLAGSSLDIPVSEEDNLQPKASRSIYVVGSKLSSLFLDRTETNTPTAGAVVIFPANSLNVDARTCEDSVHLIIHTADTGECPKDQSIIYASTSLVGSLGSQLLDNAVELLLSDIDAAEQRPAVLWRMHYQLNIPETAPSSPSTVAESRLILFPATLSADLVFDDEVLERVKTAWRTVLELDPGGADDHRFLVFDDREGQAEDDDNDNDGVDDD